MATRRAYLFVVLFLVLQTVFFTDMFGVHSHKGILSQDASPIVLSRLSITRTTGPFSYAGLPGWCGTEPDKKFIGYQLDIYNNGSCDNYTPYLSRSGLDALIFEGFELFGAGYDSFRYITASLTALAVVLLIAWAAAEFGMVSAVLAAACLLAMRYFVLFGDNIALQPGLLLLTPLMVGFALRKGVKRLWLWTFAIFLGKLLLNGAEYVIIVYLACFVPLFFYRRGQGWTGVRKDAFAIFFGLTLALAVAAIVLFAQISIVESPAAALGHFEDRVLTRSYFPMPGNPAYYYDRMQESIGTVALTYLGIDAISIGDIRVPHWAVFLLFLAITPFAWHIAWRRKDKTLLALIGAVWSSFAAVWAWIVILKGHSAAHTFTDPLMFTLPFMYLGFVLLFATIRAWLRRNTIDARAHEPLRSPRQ